MPIMKSPAQDGECLGGKCGGFGSAGAFPKSYFSMPHNVHAGGCGVRSGMDSDQAVYANIDQINFDRRSILDYPLCRVCGEEIDMVETDEQLETLICDYCLTEDQDDQ